MLGLLKRYAAWLHTGWPAGTVEPLPLIGEDGSTNVPGLYVTGDLTGVPLLKFSSDTGARAVRTIAEDPAFQSLREETADAEEVRDLVVVGGGVSGTAAALEARRRGLSYTLLEASEPFSTIVNFPKGKPIYTYPSDMTPSGELQLTAEVKEDLVAELREQAEGLERREARAERVERAGRFLDVVLATGERLRARRVIVAIGRSGSFRKLGVPGEDRDKVTNRLHDPQDYAGQDVLVVGGGDSAIEAAVALVQGGARVRLSYRKPAFSRPKPENVAKVHALAADPGAEVSVEEPSSERVTTSTGRYLRRRASPAGRLDLSMESELSRIDEDTVTLVTSEGEEETLPNQAVFAMTGRQAPLDFFRRSGVRIRGEWRWFSWVSFASFLLLCAAVYTWKEGGTFLHPSSETFPKTAADLLASLGETWKAWVEDRTTWLGTLAVSLESPSFYYTVAYSGLVTVFGIRRIRRRRTPYVTLQTATLIAIQVVPLFVLPELVLPYLGYNGWFAGGWLGSVADALFPLYVESDAVWPASGHPRAYWKAYGLVLAWPLFIYNVFTSSPGWAWLGISFAQTFVLIPLIVWRWGKGAYCGWICSCGALAETLGDAQRHKMPHGPFWNRLNLVGQGILLVALAFLGLRVAGWALGPESWPSRAFQPLVHGTTSDGGINLLSYKWVVDISLTGILGLGCYFWLSGRVWCRFACPLAALMHVYARFSQFRILADKKRCISCNVCTSVCHQGIDVMSFANKGLPMEDPQCVRCGACVQSCPTGVLEFGRVRPGTGEVLARDSVPASPVLMAERAPRRLPVVE